MISDPTGSDCASSEPQITIAITDEKAIINRDGFFQDLALAEIRFTFARGVSLQRLD
jgi:hypothetical protein